MFEIGQLIENQYLILEIRRGRRWIVYVAQDQISERVFLIKRPAERLYADAFDADTFMRKAKTWIDIGESNQIAAAYLLKEFDGIPHLFIEYIDGPSLADILCSRPGKPLPNEQTIALMTELIEGMRFIHNADLLTHEEGAIHGNLNPRNILTTSGDIKITDIGILQAFRTPTDISRANIPPERIPYMAPEQLEDPTLESRLIDIYSFGAVMYEVATGTPPTNIRLMDASAKIAFGTDAAPPRLRNRQCPRWLEETILKCMARAPENRFQSFDHIKALFDKIEKEEKNKEGEGRRKSSGQRVSRVARIRGIAKKESSRLNHYYIGVEHLMLSLLAEEESIVMSVLGDMVDPEKLRAEILSTLPKGEGPWRWNGIKKTPRYKKVMRLARQIQRTYSDERMLPHHILLAILKEGQNIPVRALKSLDIDAAEACKKLQIELGRRRPSILVTGSDSPTARFTHRVSCTTEYPYFTPFTGRQVELRNAQDMLLHDRYSIMIVGRPGVGKTAFTRQLACEISEIAVDVGVDYGSMYKLRTPALLSETADEDDLVDNLRSIFDEIVESKSILIIEDLPLLLCLCAKVSPQVAALFDEYTSSKGLLIVTTATPEGRALCESKHGNIMQFLERVNLQEPSEDETFAMLKGAEESFEIEHSVEIGNDTLQAVINLSTGLQTSRALPARAFELLDSACMTARLAPGAEAGQGHKIPVTPEHVKQVVSAASQSENPSRETEPEEYLEPGDSREIPAWDQRDDYY